MPPMTDKARLLELADQEDIDRFYWEHGPCCSGCDHWRSVTRSVGECAKSAPMAGSERAALLGMENISMPVGAGHPLTNRQYHCGDFRDNFDWLSLPVGYLARIMTRGQHAALRAIALTFIGLSPTPPLL